MKKKKKYSKEVRKLENRRDKLIRKLSSTQEALLALKSLQKGDFFKPVFNPDFLKEHDRLNKEFQK